MANWIEWDNESLRWTIKLGFIKIKIRDKVKFKQRRLEFQKKLEDTPIVKNKIVFSNYFGKSYGCNPKYIADEIIRQNLPYELVWLVRNPEEHISEFPKQVRLVRYLSPESYTELASAKVWVDNTRKKPYWEQGLIKKKEQVYIQTWHGPLGMKKIEASIKNESPMWRKFAKIDSKNIDYLLASNETDRKILSECFWFDGPILKTGYPRNDIFFANDAEKQKIKDKVYSKLNIKENEKILLYLPTFRDNGRISAFNLDILNALKAAEENQKQNYVAAIKLHPNTPKSVKELFDFNNEKIIDAIDYPDVQELLIASDIIITDYSSGIFDAMLEYTKCFIFATDLKEYSKERGFYFPLSDTPFSIAENNEQLIDNILNFDNEAYKNKVEQYLKDKEYILDANSSSRVVEKIKQSIGEI